jgi:release factor glutamine methyltransferase
VELCAGSGASSAAIAAERPGCRQYAVELSPAAARAAEANLAGTGVALAEGDMAGAFPELDGQVDLVIANPPYIPLEAWEHVAADVRTHEPALALFSGMDGLDAMKVVARAAARLLRPGGLVCAEHAEVQSESAVSVFARTGAFTQVADHTDLNDRPRFVTAVRAGKLAG